MEGVHTFMVHKLFAPGLSVAGGGQSVGGLGSKLTTRPK